MSEMSMDNPPLAEAPPGGLKEHMKLRLDLAGVIRSVMELFHHAKDPREYQARRLLSHLAEDRFNLAVVGQFKRGKSSLMNAVIGMDRLPTGILPLTSVITTVRYGDRESVLVRHRGWSLPQEVPLARLEEYVTEKGNPGNRKHVEMAEVLLPSEILRLGFHFIDTPGVGSSIAENTETTHRFLPEIDAVVFVTSFESTMNEGELAFLRTVGRHVHKIFFVANKLDLVSPDESEAVLTSIQKTISAQLGAANPRVFAVSARWGLEAKLSGDREMLARSGLLDLESALTRFLTSEKAQASLLRSIERAIMLLMPEQVEGRAGDVAVRLDHEALSARMREWDSRMRKIEMECFRATEALQGRVTSELLSRFEPSIAKHCKEVRDRLAAQVDLFLRGGRKKSITAQDLRELTDRAGGVADERRRQWLSDHEGEFVEALWTLASETVDRLERLYNETLGFAVWLIGAHPSAAKWTIEKDETNFSWRTAAPFEWRPRFAWELDILPLKWVRRRARRDYGRTLEAAVEAYRDRVAQGLAAAGSEWANRLTSEVQYRLRDLNARMKAAFCGSAVSAFSDDARVLLSRLETMRQEVSDKVPDESTPLSPIPARRHAIPQCLICERIEEALFDFFTKGQHKAPMNGAERPANRPVGRFCPLHTWQHAQISSARDISLSYAPLLAATARSLRDIATSASAPRSMADRIRDLYPSGAQCPACRRAAEVEEKAIEEFRQMSLEGDEKTDAGLCVPHLSAVLNREADLQTARNLLFQQADVLDRISEDMQTYSLKHDAVRRELATDEELTAYLCGLSLLVGHRKLSAA